MNHCTPRTNLLLVAVQYLMFGTVAMLLEADTALAQVQDSTVFEFQAAPLRLVWVDSGRVANERYGRGFGSLGDLFGTGRSAWAVGNRNDWQVYVADTIHPTGLITATRRKLIVAGDGMRPIAGDFWGTGRKALCLSATTTSTHYCLFRLDSDTIPQYPTATIDPGRLTPPLHLASPEAIVADLDRDGDDELIIRASGLFHDGTLDKHGQIWIYAGGPNFLTDSPTVTLRDPFASLEPAEMGAREGTRASIVATDLDGDGWNDLATVVRYGNGAHALRFYWGSGTLDGYQSASNQREVAFAGDGPDAGWGITRLDCDGDGASDLVLGGTGYGVPSSYLFRSGRGKSARTRSYQRDDADLTWPGAPESFNAGPLNDETGYYDMLLVKGSTMHNLFSGGPRGPDKTVEAYLRADGDVSFAPIEDANGNGYSELMMADPQHGGVGMVAIYERGPVIAPPTHITAQEIATGILLWPNPATDEVNITWRSDLPAMPRRLVVHDVRGTQLAQAEVPPGAASGFWYCRGVATGVYLVSVYAADGSLIASARVLKD